MSSYLDFAVQDREELKQYILRSLGAPFVTVELTDDHLDDAINDALEYFTKYVSFDRKYLAINLEEEYIESKGVILPNNVVSVFSMDDASVGMRGDRVDRLFSIPNQMMNNGMLEFPVGGGAGGWLAYDMARSHLDLIKRMLGGGMQFEYNERTRVLELLPDPIKSRIHGWIVIGCNTIRPSTMLMGESWVKKYSLAKAKITLGTIRANISDVTLLGGGRVDTSVREAGMREIETLESELSKTEGGCLNFYIM